MESNNLNLRMLTNGGRKQNTEIVESKENKRSNEVEIGRSTGGQELVKAQLEGKEQENKTGKRGLNYLKIQTVE